MVKGKVFLIALMTALAFTSSVCAEVIFAMGADGGSLQPRENMKTLGDGKGKGEKNLDKGKTGEGAITREKEEEEENASPKKKPRLKYWDPYECGC